MQSKKRCFSVNVEGQILWPVASWRHLFSQGVRDGGMALHVITVISDSEEEEEEEVLSWGPKAPRSKSVQNAEGEAAHSDLQSNGRAAKRRKSDRGSQGFHSPHRFSCGLPCQICEKLIPPREFLAHCHRHTLIPCELCNELLDPSQLMEHMKHHEGQLLAPPSPDLIPCEVCGDLFAPSKYRQHLQEHLQASQATEESLCVTPVSMAARWVEQLRCEEKSLLEPRLAGPRVVYHWTPSTNFNSIININLQVPDQKRILNQTDDGYYGAGIYTSPSFLSFQGYAHGKGGCFLCLGLPGRQHIASKKKDRGRPCRANHETHVSPNQQEWVFFSSDQLLPCFLIDKVALQPKLLGLVQTLEASIRKDLGLSR